MRVWTLAAIATLFAPVGLHADDAARETVKKALAATGWEKRKTDHATWRDKGVFTMPGGPMKGQTMKYDGIFHITYPDKYRFDMEIEIGTQKMNFKIGAQGDKAWEAASGQVRDVTGDKLKYMQDEAWLMYCHSLRPLLTDKEITLATIEPAMIDGKKCQGISVARKNMPTVKLFFNPEFLPVRMQCPMKNEFDGWKDATDELDFSDWTEKDGVKHYGKMKITRNGEKMIEADISDYKDVEKVDPKLYDKPSS